MLTVSKTPKWNTFSRYNTFTPRCRTLLRHGLSNFSPIFRSVNHISAVDLGEMQVLDGGCPLFFSGKRCRNARPVRRSRSPSECARLQVDSKATLKMTIEKIKLTRTIRGAYNICMAFAKPFNRTSLELKRQDLRRSCKRYARAFNRTSLELKQHVVSL